jgi:hypothetical protein
LGNECFPLISSSFLIITMGQVTFMRTIHTHSRYNRATISLLLYVLSHLMFYWPFFTHLLFLGLFSFLGG